LPPPQQQQQQQQQQQHCRPLPLQRMLSKERLSLSAVAAP
jgi:transcription initiation factor TFIID subunit TAF12